jgi:2-alkenal reductase
VVRRGFVAAIALLCALAGGLAALGIGKATGWVGRSSSKTIVVKQTVSAPAPASQPLERTAAPLTGNGFDPAAIYRRRVAGVVTIFSYFGGLGGSDAQGSGFVASKDGYILTNAHVITSAGSGDSGSRPAAASEVDVEFADHDRVSARIVGWDVFDDVGVIRVDPADHPLAPLPLGDSASVEVGEPVAVIGSPFGNENSLAVGVVSAVHRSIASLTSAYDLVDAIQIDAPINHGNSGGPLLDAEGRVIGINAQIRSDSGNAEGVGFSVPVDSARRSMEELVATGKVRYAYVGILTEDLSRSLARHLHLPVERGALVDVVYDGGPAAKAGLRGGDAKDDFNGVEYTRGGDVIVAIGGVTVTGSQDVVRIVSALKPYQRVTFAVVRGQKRLNVPIVLGERPVDPRSGH